MVPLARGSGSWKRLSGDPNRLPHALNQMLRILNRLHWILNRIIVTYLDVSRFEMTCGNVISLCLHAQSASGKGASHAAPIQVLNRKPVALFLLSMKANMAADAGETPQFRRALATAGPAAPLDAGGAGDETDLLELGEGEAGLLLG